MSRPLAFLPFLPSPLGCSPVGERRLTPTEVVRASFDAGQAQAQLLGHLGAEPGAVAVGGVEVVVVGPGQRPVVAVLGLADDRRRGSPGDPPDDRAAGIRVDHRPRDESEEAADFLLPLVGARRELRLGRSRAQPHGHQVEARADHQDAVAQPECPEDVPGHVRRASPSRCSPSRSRSRDTARAGRWAGSPRR